MREKDELDYIGSVQDVERLTELKALKSDVFQVLNEAKYFRYWNDFWIFYFTTYKQVKVNWDTV